MNAHTFGCMRHVVEEQAESSGMVLRVAEQVLERDTSAPSG